MDEATRKRILGQRPIKRVQQSTQPGQNFGEAIAMDDALNNEFLENTIDFGYDMPGKKKGSSS